MHKKNSYAQKNLKSVQALHDLRAPFAVIKHCLRKENFLNNTVLHSAFDRFELLLQEVSEPRQQKQTPTTQPKRSVQELLFSAIAEKQMYLKIDSPRNIQFSENLIDFHEALYIPGSEFEFTRMVSNVIDNAIEAIPSTTLGKIDINISCTPGSLSISISDNGIGVPDTLINVLGRTPLSFNKNGGSGLGLYYARRVLRQLDGEFQLTNNVDKGLTIKMTIPILH